MVDAVRVEIIGNATLYLGDCRDVLPTLAPVDAVVTDPPYGIKEAAGKARTRKTGQATGLGLKRSYVRDYGDAAWDNEPVPQDLMDAVRRAGRWNVIFGGNYYALPPTSCWLVWDKENTGDFADAELAWTNLPKAVRLIRYMWNGMLRANQEPRGDHPTQKPVGVMRWAIGHLPADSKIVLDPFMGSGTTGVAAMQLSRGFIGIEREPIYFDAACRRIEDAQRQGSLDIEAKSGAAA
ncbi:DNA-methyltransferase [Sphingomonas hankookensis]|uniref:DNA-methyltransferase n=1 Tax=Sphingomonas hankookensis TaxID=563996 RepID=UPI003D303876